MAQGTEQTERWTYDVFLSFRGVDVRKNFLTHLYNGFRRCGISTFLDDVELERGDYISTQLLEAIETSKILIVVLSKDYASSAWCLDELVHIMKSQENNHSVLVFPVFFYVDPSDIRRQKGTFAQPFSKHETRYPLSKVKEWREALTKVANLSGWDIRHWNEAECIEDITREILKRLSFKYLHVHPYVVGMRSRLERISLLLSIGSGEEVQVIGICGMSGIGKTTLAKVAFNEFSHLFDGSSFLENFREYSKKPEGRTHLQHQLLTDILKRNDIGFSGLDHAVKERFRNKRLLIVIDDVDDIHQINSVAIDPSCFGHGSRIIVTTRNMHLLKQLHVKGSCLLEELGSDQSLELFSWHAFRTSEPPEEFLQLSKQVVTYCAGLPLAVEVLGSFLIERSISEWKSTLEMLKQMPNQNIQANLRISFDGLDSLQKDVFLDIACFFIGMDKDYVAGILEGCNLYPDIVLNVLKEKCLITISGYKIKMHDLLRDMGRQIVREISSKKCGEQSRLWNHEDVISVLRTKSGTNAVEGLSFKGGDVWSFEVEAFTEMQRLRLLQLSHVNLNGSYEQFPEDLRWLSWDGFSSDFFPTNLSIRSLVILDMQWSKLKQFWKAKAHPQQANMLRYVDLSNSVYLRETPDFCYMPNVEKLLLVNCKSLVLVDKSIGILQKKLVLLNLSRCTELDSLPEEFYKLKSLETLILSHCSKFERFDDDAFGYLESLTTLNADATALKEIPSSINQLKKLITLSLDGCKGLVLSVVDTVNPSSSASSSMLLRPVSLSGLSCLTNLSLAYCNLSDDMMPTDIGSLSFLMSLNLEGNDFCNLQVDFAGLTELFHIRLNSCSKLQSILTLPRSLKYMFAEDCILLERIPDLSECPELHQLIINDCLSLVETPGIRDCKSWALFIAGHNCKLISNTCKKLLKEWIKKYHKNIYVPGYETPPNWIRFKAEMSSFSFRVAESHNSGPVTGFTAWRRFLAPGFSIYGTNLRSNSTSLDSGDYIPLIVKNLTRDSCWIPDLDNLFINDFCIETGDQIKVDAGSSYGITILEMGFALSYSPIDSSDFSEIDYFSGEDHRMHWQCGRSRESTRVVIGEHNNNSMNEVKPQLWAYGFTPQPSRDQENNQPVVVVEERHHRSSRKMIMGLGKLLGAISFMTLTMFLGKNTVKRQ